MCGQGLGRKLAVVLICAVVTAAGATAVLAHCDRINGPVAMDAVEALEQGDFSTIQIWVGEEQEQELRSRFDEAREVRQQGEAAREMADRYFIETAIRLHREAEGVSFTGVKPAADPAPDIVAAERALEEGDLSIVTRYLNEQIEEEVGTWFDRALQAREAKDAGIEAGREWVDAYVKYVVFVHTLNETLLSGPQHGVGGH